MNADHDDDTWGAKIFVVWVALTATLHQAEHARQLALDLTDVAAQARGAEMRPASSAAIQVVVEGRSRLLPLDEIAFVKAEENYCLLRCVDEAILTRATLAHFEQDLAPEFARVHRSFLINLRHVVDVQRDGRATVAEMSTGETTPIARGRADRFASAWRAYRGMETRDARRSL